MILSVHHFFSCTIIIFEACDCIKHRWKPDGPFAPRLETSWQSIRVQKEILEEVFFTCQMRQCWDVQNSFLSTYWRHPVVRAPPHWHQTTALEEQSSVLLQRYFHDTLVHLTLSLNFARHCERHFRRAWSPEKNPNQTQLKMAFSLSNHRTLAETSVGQECSLQLQDFNVYLF